MTNKTKTIQSAIIRAVWQCDCLSFTSSCNVSAIIIIIIIIKLIINECDYGGVSSLYTTYTRDDDNDDKSERKSCGQIAEMNNKLVFWSYFRKDP